MLLFGPLSVTQCYQIGNFSLHPHPLLPHPPLNLFLIKKDINIPGAKEEHEPHENNTPFAYEENGTGAIIRWYIAIRGTVEGHLHALSY